MVPKALRDGAGVAKYRHEALAVVLQVRPDGESASLSVLAWKRPREPYRDRWALPSGPVEVDEGLEESVRRHLAAKVDLSEIAHLEQLGTESAPERDPFERTIATAYLGLVRWTKEALPLARAQWLPVEDLLASDAEAMAFDHQRIVRRGVKRMRAKLSYTNLGFALAPAEFTIAELRHIYAEALGHDVSATNLQRILSRRRQLEATGGMAPTGRRGGRPAALFRFASQELEVTDPFAVLRPVD